MDTAKEIAMVENNAKGREARQYFIAVEAQFKQIIAGNQFNLPQNYREALVALLGEVEKVERLEAVNAEQAEQIAVTAPKVGVYDTLVDVSTGGLLTLREAAKAVGK